MEYVLEKIGSISGLSSILMGIIINEISTINYLLISIFIILTLGFWMCAIVSVIILYKR